MSLSLAESCWSLPPLSSVERAPGRWLLGLAGMCGACCICRAAPGGWRPRRLHCSPRRSPEGPGLRRRGTEGHPEREGFAVGRSLPAPTVAEQCSHPSGSSGSPCWVGLGAGRRSQVGGSPRPRGLRRGCSQGSPEPRSSSSAFSPPARETPAPWSRRSCQAPEWLNLTGWKLLL